MFDKNIELRTGVCIIKYFSNKLFKLFTSGNVKDFEICAYFKNRNEETCNTMIWTYLNLLAAIYCSGVFSSLYSSLSNY